MNKIKKFESFSQSEIDRILDKINSTGIGSLTPSEKRYLDNPDETNSPLNDDDDSHLLDSPTDMEDLFIDIYDYDDTDFNYNFGFGFFSKSTGYQIDSEAFEILDEEILSDFESNEIEEVGECDFLADGDNWKDVDSLKEYLHGLGFKDVRYKGK